MRYILLITTFLVCSYSYGQTNNESLFEALTNSTGIPNPPSVLVLPSLEDISAIITPSNTLEDINDKFEDMAPYTGRDSISIPENAKGVWWRFYTQTTSLFNILAVSEEILSIDNEGIALWLQNIKTPNTVNSSSQRKLVISYFDLFNHMFFVFHYRDQDPTSQKIRDKQGFFVRILADSSYMQMSTSPNFEPEKSMYWRRFPEYNKEILNDQNF